MYICTRILFRMNIISYYKKTTSRAFVYEATKVFGVRRRSPSESRHLLWDPKVVAQTLDYLVYLLYKDLIYSFFKTCSVAVCFFRAVLVAQPVCPELHLTGGKKYIEFALFIIKTLREPSISTTTLVLLRMKRSLISISQLLSYLHAWKYVCYLSFVFISFVSIVDIDTV